MKNLFKTSIMRKCLVFGVVLILTLTTFPIFAFADDEPVEVSTSTGDSEFDQELYSLATTLYKIETADGVKAATATRTIDDIYNLLVQIFYNQSNGTNEIVVMRQFLNTINTSCNALVVKLTEFYNSVNGDYDDTGITIYDQLSAISTALTSIDGNDGDLTIIETLVYIHTALEDLDTSLSAILNSTYSIYNKLVNIHTALLQFNSDVLSSLSTINTSVNTGFTNVNANMATIISRLQAFNNDYNNLNSVDAGVYLGCTTTLQDFYNNSFLPVNTSYTTGLRVFYRITQPSNLYIIDLPVRFSSFLSDLDLSDVLYISTQGPNSGREFIPIDTYTFTFNTTGRVRLFIYSDYYFHEYIQIRFKEPYNIIIAYSDSPIKSISYTQKDYYIIYDYLKQRRELDIISKFESLYASDDLIAAKEDQQGYEDQAIEDFTGSGSAAASGSDLTDMKSISGAIKSGLQSGGSVNNALAPFNTNSGFWGWFSQNNYDNINNIPTTRLRSGNNSEPEIIDFYSNNQYTLQGLLNGGGN